MSRGWVIYYDDLEGKDVWIQGPRDFDGELSEDQVHFKMYDDDGNCYYSGVMDAQYKYEDYGDDPLTAFGMPDSGCTMLKILEKGEWVAWIG